MPWRKYLQMRISLDQNQSFDYEPDVHPGTLWEWSAHSRVHYNIHTLSEAFVNCKDECNRRIEEFAGKTRQRIASNMT